MLWVMNLRAPILAAAFSGLVALGPVAVGQVTILPGTVNTGISAISDDGTRVAGTRTGLPPYFWSQATGYQYLTTPRTPSNFHLSGDGHTLTSTAAFVQQTFLETDGGEVTVLSFSLPGQVNQSVPTGISRDGSVVCGWDTHTSSSIQVGWRWSATSGMQVLPGFNFTLSMSGDGRTIFGGNGAGQYGMWRDGVVLPVPNNFGRVQAVNYDASILAGDGRIWRDGQITTLPLLPGAGNPEIIDISEDGNVVVGTNSLFGGGQVPVVWTPATGTQRLGDYFASFGYDLSAYRIFNAHVSADGRTFGMSAEVLADHSARGIIVTVPAPATAALLAGFLTLRAPRRRHVAPTGNPA